MANDTNEPKASADTTGVRLADLKLGVEAMPTAAAAAAVVVPAASSVMRSFLKMMSHRVVIVMLVSSGPERNVQSKMVQRTDN